MTVKHYRIKVNEKVTKGITDVFVTILVYCYYNDSLKSC